MPFPNSPLCCSVHFDPDVNVKSVTLAFVVALLIVVGCAGPETDDPYRTWDTYLGDAASTQYSVLDQIHRDNVDSLRVAWTYHTGDVGPEDRTQIQTNPLIVDTVLFGVSPKLKVFALHAATGKALWTYDPFADGTMEGPGINRGLVYWEDGDDRRILSVAGSRLFALHAATGELIEQFGTGGHVDLKEGLGRDVGTLFLTARTPGIVYEDLLIQGTSLSEGPDTAPGHIRAYDLRTGEMAWIFHTIPHPGEAGYETWPKDAWERIGGANAWTGLALDRERGIVFIPTGSAAFDFYGGNRAGKNLYANSLLALDAATGERIWHFQTVHHDLWDRDLPAPPNLVTVEHDGRRIDAVAQVTKHGYVFLFDRATGEPLFPIEERPVPSSDLKGEETWPTQPFPLRPPPFARQRLDEADLTERTPEAHAAVLERFRQVRSDGQFIPPSEEGTMIFPGFDGGAEWGGAAFDPETGWLYVNSNEMPWILTMVEVAPEEGQSVAAAGKYVYTTTCASCHGANRQGHANFPSLIDVDRRLSQQDVLDLLNTGRGFMPSFQYLSDAEKQALLAFLFNLDDGQVDVDRSDLTELQREPDVPYAHTGWNRFFDPDGYPAVKPPWGTLNAIDLNRGEIVWQVPFGEFPESDRHGKLRWPGRHGRGPALHRGHAGRDVSRVR